MSLQPVAISELVELGAVDPILFCSSFFPRTFRQSFATFHPDIWNLLEDRSHRYVALAVFRGGAKTTILRTFTAKRIAYGTSHTILFVSAAQEHSKKSLEWLRLQVETNRPFAQAFGLSKGKKWTDELIQVRSEILGSTSTVIALGITGQTRGINVADYRPDLIVVDDPCDEENTATPEQRQKINDLFFGAVAKTLAPSSECPDAKMVLLQTVLNGEDLISRCLVDPSWASRSYSCFDENGRSTWPERFSTEMLQEEKAAHIKRGQLPLWLREMECKVVSSETSTFRPEWLKYWDILPEGMAVFIAIDPVPPPSERERATGCKNKDFEAIAVVGAFGGQRFLLDYSLSRGHTPEWTVTEFFRLVDKWHPLKAKIEGVAYQRTLKWLLEQEMKKRGRFIQIDAVTDRRKKAHRITQAFSGVASNGMFAIHQTHREFYEQFVSYPNVAHDDLLDAVAMAMPDVTEAVGLPALLAGAEMMEGLPDSWRVAP
jgi:predicted phage terminase large subunit-like protein